MQRSGRKPCKQGLRPLLNLLPEPPKFIGEPAQLLAVEGAAEIIGEQPQTCFRF